MITNEGLTKKIEFKRYKIELVPVFVKLNKIAQYLIFWSTLPEREYIDFYYLIFSTPLIVSLLYSLALIPIDAIMGIVDPRTRLTPLRTLPRLLVIYKEQTKPSVLFENRRVTRTIRMNGSMSWMETMNLHSIPGLLLTLESRFTLSTFVEMAEYYLCFTHKDNTQIVIALNYWNELFINQQVNHDTRGLLLYIDLC